MSLTIYTYDEHGIYVRPIYGPPAPAPTPLALEAGPEDDGEDIISWRSDWYGM